MSRKLSLAVVAAAAGGLFAMPASAEGVKVGMITTLSGGGSGLGIDIRDGFELALKQGGGTLGGVSVELIVSDDARKPETAKQIADRMVKSDKVDIMTGIVWSNLAMAVVPGVTKGGTFYISPNAGPSALAGKMCNENYFNVAWQNDNLHEAMGQHVSDRGYKNVFILAPNYPAGRDALAGFKRYYKGALAGEIYTRLGQKDYAAEISALRAAKPDAVFFFLPGGMGINFLKQYDRSGLKGKIPMFGPAFSISAFHCEELNTPTAASPAGLRIVSSNEKAGPKSGICPVSPAWLYCLRKLMPMPPGRKKKTASGLASRRAAISAA